MTYWLIEPPSLGADLDVWERHLKSLADHPQDDEGVMFSVEHAKRIIALKKGEVENPYDSDEEFLAEIDAIFAP